MGHVRGTVFCLFLETLTIRTFSHSEAHDAAEQALVVDPRSVKARYLRGMARKHMEMRTAAEIGVLRTIFTTAAHHDSDMRQTSARCSLLIQGIKIWRPSWRPWKKDVATPSFGRV